jgi:hypothetical protein
VVQGSGFRVPGSGFTAGRIETRYLEYGKLRTMNHEPGTIQSINPKLMDLFHHPGAIVVIFILNSLFPPVIYYLCQL